MHRAVRQKVGVILEGESLASRVTPIDGATLCSWGRSGTSKRLIGFTNPRSSSAISKPRAMVGLLSRTNGATASMNSSAFRCSFVINAAA